MSKWSGINPKNILFRLLRYKKKIIDKIALIMATPYILCKNCCIEMKWSHIPDNVRPPWQGLHSPGQVSSSGFQQPSAWPPGCWEHPVIDR